MEIIGIFVTVWLVLFAGNPDLSDAINSRVNCEPVLVKPTTEE